MHVAACAGPHCNGVHRAAARIAQLGYAVKEMIGGVTGWLDEGLSLSNTDIVQRTSTSPLPMTYVRRCCSRSCTLPMVTAVKAWEKNYSSMWQRGREPEARAA